MRINNLLTVSILALMLAGCGTLGGRAGGGAPVIERGDGPEGSSSEIQPATPKPEKPKTEPLQADPKKVSAARKYLSDNKKKLADLHGEEYDALIAKMQERYDYLIETDAGVSDEQKAAFKELGLNV